MKHLEVERKYDVDDDFVMPELAQAREVTMTAGVVEHRLDATYHDTEALDLARHGVTLRRRTGGADQGWHLKRPAGPGARTESVAPLRDDAGIPEEFDGELRALTRGRPLRPVARVTTNRSERPLRSSDGTTLAVVTDDEVSAQALGDEVVLRRWREVEVELVDGPESVLEQVERVLLAAGARAPVAASKLARALEGRLPRSPKSEGAWSSVGTYARAQRDALLTLDPLVRRDEPDAVHKMRVACRRLRSTLRTFRPLLDRARTEPLRQELRWLAGELGHARDAEVMADRLDQALASEPSELVIGPVSRQVVERFSTESAEARVRVLAALDSPRYAALLDSLDEVVDGPPTKPASRPALRGMARKALRRVDRRLAKAEKLADGRSAGSRLLPPLPGVVDDRATALHDARKAAKRARYAAEALQDLGGKDARRLVKTLKHLQNVLGAYQDSVLTRQVLRDHGVRTHLDGENAFTYGLLHARQQAEGERALAALPSAQRRIDRGRVRSWLK